MTQNTLDEDVMIEFRRFPQEKQDQVRALVNYATLMGLNGKDLVSIGGKLDRVAAKREIEHNRNIVANMGVRPIGKDKDCYSRWAWADAQGVIYHFANSNYHSVTITNTKTKHTLRRGYNHWGLANVGRWSYQKNVYLPKIMLGIYNGDIHLP